MALETAQDVRYHTESPSTFIGEAYMACGPSLSMTNWPNGTHPEDMQNTDVLLYLSWHVHIHRPSLEICMLDQFVSDKLRQYGRMTSK
jgi:hypothetical protein